MAKKEGMIVIKKITVVGGGHHGGSWKVALADFMTAMMAFFLVMWLLGQSSDVKKAVSDYFSTPSVIEYNFQNFGVEITLEKLFLDLLNEPMKAFQSFMEPVDKTPNLMDMGSAKVVAAYLADQLSDYAKNVQVNPDGFEFDIPDNLLFERGSGTPTPGFVTVMDKLKGVTTGLKDSTISINTMMFVQSVNDGNPVTANRVASERLDLVMNKVEAGLEFNSVNIKGKTSVKEKKGEVDPNKLIGLVRITIKQKEVTSDGRKQRKLESMFGPSNVDMLAYDKMVQKMSHDQAEVEGQKRKVNSTGKIKNGYDPGLQNPIDEEFPGGKRSE